MICQLFLATTSCRQEMGMSKGVCANMEPDFGQVFMPAQHSAYSLFISHYIEGGNARDLFPGAFHEHEESFRRQNCSEAAFSASSMSGIANTNEFRPETVQRSQNRELGITEMGINEESTQNNAPLPSTEMLKDSELNSIANSESRTMAEMHA